MPRCAITAAITITTRASSPWRPWSQPFVRSSTGVRKIWTVPTTKRENVYAIHFHSRGQAPNAVRKTSSSAPWMSAKPVKPCASRALSPAPATYAVMKYACRKISSDDQRRQHEVDPQECSSHAREPTGPAG